jgi:hypothetical protein
MTQNSFPLRQWHINHMEKIVLRFITGLSPNATAWEKENWLIPKIVRPSFER